MTKSADIESSSKLTPWLLWAGGKRKLAKMLVPEILATKPNLYIEPFLGGGAVALALPAELPKVLADVNRYLIDCWLCMQRTPSALRDDLWIAELTYGNHKAGYMLARKQFNRLIHNPSMWARRSALLIYLNARAFNGLWRVNDDGEFNVPFGQRKAPRSITDNEFRAYHAALTRSTILATDFVELFATGKPAAMFKPGAAIFADCPYDGTFDGYSKGGFDEGNQQLLADWLEVAAQRGAAVWATNADTSLVREMYRWAQIEEITERHSVGATGDRRGNRGCLLIRGGAACR